MNELTNAFVFEGVPMPPTSNKAYKSFVHGGRIRHVCHPDLVRFKGDFNAYSLLNRATFNLAREALAGAKLPSLGIYCDFYFEHSKLYTKDGRLKRLDVSNRLKALHDCLADSLGIDDCLFTRISASKQVGGNCVTVTVALL